MIVNKSLLYFVIFIVVGAIIFGIYFSATRSKNNNTVEPEPQIFDSQKEKDDQAIIDAVNLLVLVPTSVKPTIATISDKDQIKNEKFLSKAETGDKLLLYSTVGRGILYRPSVNKIIDIMPISSSEDQIDLSGQSDSNTIQGSTAEF